MLTYSEFIKQRTAIQEAASKLTIIESVANTLDEILSSTCPLCKVWRKGECIGCPLTIETMDNVCTSASGLTLYGSPEASFNRLLSAVQIIKDVCREEKPHLAKKLAILGDQSVAFPDQYMGMDYKMEEEEE